MKPGRDEKPEAVYRACRGRMYQAAYRILRDPAEAEDAVHEGFISMLPFLDRVDDPASPRMLAFAAAAAESRAIDIYRKRSRGGLVPFDDAIAVSAPSSDGSISETIAALPGESRRLLLLRYDVGLKVAEIARLTGKSYHAVYNGIERAKARLAEELSKGGIDI